MRLALVSLIAAATASSVAWAQEPTPAPTEPAAATADVPLTTAVPATPGPDVTAEPAPAAPAADPAVEPISVPMAAEPASVSEPAPAAPMAPPAPVAATPEPAPAQPVWTAPAAEPAPAVAAPPAAEPVWVPPAPVPVWVPPAPEPPPPPPPPPTDPTAIAVLNAIERICQPLVKGGDLGQLSTPLGYKKKKDNYVYAMATKPYQITILAQGSNKNVCMIEVDYPINGIEPVVVGVHNWAMARTWKLYRNDKYVTDLERHTRSWELVGQTEAEALVLVSQKKADGTPLNKKADHATVLYSLTAVEAPPAQ